MSSTAPPRVSEPLARAALRLVGKDLAAEAIWLTAINDPSMPASARTDLIEDLNDAGYADLKAFSAGDVTLIEKRLAIVERLAPYAMDQVNKVAFEEAYKDLLAMLVRARGGSGK